MSKSDKTHIEIIPIPPRGDFVEVTDRAVTIRKTMTLEEAKNVGILSELIWISVEDAKEIWPKRCGRSGNKVGGSRGSEHQHGS